jgi:hypothetical protein
MSVRPSTTQGIWRSGADASRQAYCGSMVMTAQFYIADVGPASTANVKVSSATGAPDLILPANAVVMSVVVSAVTDATGTFDLGWATVSGDASDTDGLVDGYTSAIGTITVGTATVAGNDLGVAMDTTENVYITVTDGTAGGGTASGYLVYYVIDPLVGQQSA